jgi:D-3-phosphoglycerate dehydrogenase
MANPRDIVRPSLGSPSVSYTDSVSPTAFRSPVQGSFPAGSLPQRAAEATRHLKPFNTEDIKILLLENVNQTGRDILKAQGYQVEFMKSSLPEDQLIEKIR